MDCAIKHRRHGRLGLAVCSTLSCGVLRETFFEGASRCNVRVVYEAAALQQRSSSQHGQASGKDKPQGVHAQPGVPKVHFAKPLAKFATKGAKASSAKPAPVLKAAAPEPEQLVRLMQPVPVHHAQY